MKLSLISNAKNMGRLRASKINGKPNKFALPMNNTKKKAIDSQYVLLVKKLIALLPFFDKKNQYNLSELLLPFNRSG